MASFDPYHKWLGIPPKDQPPTYYRLLGLETFEADADVISMAADRQIAHVRKLAIGPHTELSQQILNELARAKATLLDRRAKADYDTKLQSRSVARADGSAAAAPSVPLARPAPASSITPRPEAALVQPPTGHEAGPIGLPFGNAPSDFASAGLRSQPGMLTSPLPGPSPPPAVVALRAPAGRYSSGSRRQRHVKQAAAAMVIVASMLGLALWMLTRGPTTPNPAADVAKTPSARDSPASEVQAGNTAPGPLADGAEPPVALPTGLVSWWTGDDTPADLLGLNDCNHF